MIESTLELKAASRLRDLLAENEDLRTHISRMLVLGEAVVFGGWVRDTLHSIVHGVQLESRDLDLVVQGTLPGNIGTEGNHFGGHRFRLSGGLSIDCWELSRTLAFTRGFLTPSFPNLLLSTVYRLNGCFIDMRTYRLQGEAAIEDIRNRSISFNCTGYINVYPEYQAFRAIDLRERFGYVIEKEVANFVAETLKKAGRERFAQEVLEHRQNESLQRLDRLFLLYSG